MATDSIRGTEFKLNVRMEPIDGKYHLSNIDWEVELSTRKVGSKAQIIKKEQARKVTDDDYIIVVDSSIGGAGRYHLLLTAFVPDADCKDGARVEKVSVDTGVIIADI